MQSLEREPLLESRRRSYGDFSGLGRLRTFGETESSTSSNTLYEDDDIRVTLGKHCILNTALPCLNFKSNMYTVSKNRVPSLFKVNPGWPQHRENREFGSYFFQTGKTQGILL